MKTLCSMIALLSLVVCGVRAQMQGSDANSNLQSLGTGSGMFRSFDDRFKGMEGYPTVLEKYVKGIITMETGKTIFHTEVNFDVYNNELLVMRNQAEAIVGKHLIKSFVLLYDGDTLKFQKVKSGEDFNFYTPLVVDGQNHLYKKFIKKVREANNTGAYSSGRTYSILEDDEEFYFRVGEEGDLVEIKNKKTILSYFKAQESEINSFIKRDKTDFKREDDLTRFFEYLNQISSR